ncbi:enoyl-CoA hydratase/isomerase family protein [Oleomonas cavernae]|uniref:Enoyl-CoA hydratase/isomerase family protein n=1 Tax=Oleomonas cavernae TaxID=2320859 RepID=A0A418WDX2_9PROT|nr:enoyl-CoA hydratase/isomerase family protein [Oleomonas cavernae]RJF88211.1 enoyl-CoA hydratase/isomerase family protein [Oleomonas cavernae]
MAYEKLIFDRKGEVTTITLNRPSAHNALDKELSAELNAAVREVRADRDCRILVIRGAGDTFCAGDDVKEFNDWTPEDPYWQIELYQETVNLIEDLTPVTIAAVDGVCTGGGLELTLVCDFVIATNRTRWGMPEIDWDITPGWGGISRISRFAGRRKAKEWNMIGALFDTETAERYNLVNKICAPEDLDKEVAALSEVMLAKNPIALRRTKFALNKSADMTVHQALSLERPIDPYPPAKAGIADFQSKVGRDKRRNLSRGFWQA